MPRVEQVQQKALEEFREKNRNAAKRKKNKGASQLGESAITFVCLFFLLSLLFLQVAKKMTPKIDTSVGNNVEVAETTEPKGTIDDRLKLIQFNDAMASAELQKQKENEMFNEALEEKVVIPQEKETAEGTEETGENPDLSDKVQDIISKNIAEVQTLNPQQEQEETEPAAAKQPKAAPVPESNVSNAQQMAEALTQTRKKEELDKKISAIKEADINIPTSANYKVLVGRYQTAEQAQLAKSIIRETELGQNAFVKRVNNSYTVQIGSYSTAEQASAVANQLTTGSFPARVYYEKPVKPSAQDGKTIF